MKKTEERKKGEKKRKEKSNISSPTPILSNFPFVKFT